MQDIAGYQWVPPSTANTARGELNMATRKRSTSFGSDAIGSDASRLLRIRRGAIRQGLITAVSLSFCSRSLQPVTSTSYHRQNSCLARDGRSRLFPPLRRASPLARDASTHRRDAPVQVHVVAVVQALPAHVLQPRTAALQHTPSTLHSRTRNHSSTAARPQRPQRATREGQRDDAVALTDESWMGGELTVGAGISLRPNFERHFRYVFRSSVLPVARFLTYLPCFRLLLKTPRAGGTMTRTVESVCQVSGTFNCIFAISLSTNTDSLSFHS